MTQRAGAEGHPPLASVQMNLAVGFSERLLTLLRFTQFRAALCCVHLSYLCDGHLRVLLLLLELLLKELQVVLRRQRRERAGASAAGGNALGRHGEDGPPIEVLNTHKDKRVPILLMKEKEHIVIVNCDN